jgi:hypothetical protein
MLTKSSVDLMAEKLKVASAIHRWLTIEHDAMLPSVRFGGRYKSRL